MCLTRTASLHVCQQAPTTLPSAHFGVVQIGAQSWAGPTQHFRLSQCPVHSQLTWSSVYDVSVQPVWATFACLC